MSYTLPEPHEYVWNPDGTFDIGQQRCLSTKKGPCSGWEIYPIFTDDQMQAAHAAGRASRDSEVEALQADLVTHRELMVRQVAGNQKLRDEVEALRADAECFRYWVHEAWHSPGDMARLLSSCETPDDYRNKIIPVMQAAKAASDAAMRKEK